jgi:DNA replication protein DnaC
MTEATPSHSELREQAGALRLHGLQAHWAEVMGHPEQARWVAQMLAWEAAERGQRSLERRLRAAHIGRFKPLADFDWAWPKSIDRGAVEELMTLDFLKEASNVVLVGPNGVGKTMCACNLGYQAVLAGHTALFTTAGNLLGELAALDSDSALRRKLRQYAAPDLLVIDEVGYLSYSNRHADLLFELVSRRYQHKSTVVTTNRAFAEWGQVFPNAACVVSLVDRLMHRRRLVSRQGGRRAQCAAQGRAGHQGVCLALAQGRSMSAHPPSPAASLIPRHWTPEQALAVFECLQLLRQTLWTIYGPQVQQAWREQLVPDGQPPLFDPDEPF